MASFPDVDDVSPMLRGHSRFFMEIGSVAEALDKLNSFLEDADSESVEKLMTEFAASFVDHQAEQSFEDGCLAKLSRVLREPRVVDFISRAGSRIRNRKPVFSFIDEYFDSSRKEVVTWLMEEAPSRSILLLSKHSAIWKTDLAGLRLFDKMARGVFDRHYWIDVSGLYKIENLFEVMKGREPRIDQPLGKVLRVSSKMELIDKLMRHSVQRNRYIFSMDDDLHREFWNVIKQAFSHNDKRNWMVTTNSSDKCCDSFRLGLFDQAHQFGPVSSADSWRFFCRIAFQDETGQRCPQEFEQISKEIVTMCKGFPLPIVGIAALLSKKEKKESEWQRVRSCFKVEVKTNVHPERVLRVFSHDLSDHLSQCFLYFGVFPRDSVIPNDKLIKLWIAEGFVQENSEKTLEEVAEEYLNELIRRKLVQSFQGLNRLEQFCRVDRLIHPITPLKSSEQCFFDNIFSVNISILDLKSSRLSICTNECVNPRYLDSNLHSLFVFGGSHDLSFMTELVGRCELLMVLDFEYQPIEQISEELGKLIFLKYLSFKNTKLRKLPKSVDKLIYLQTLDVRNTLIVELPAEINRLTNLRHLLASVCDDGISVDPSQGVRLKKGIGSLLNLQTLTTVEANENGSSIIKEIAALIQLRALGISGLTAKTAKALCKCLDKLVRLKSLTMQAMNGEEVLNLASISSELPLLRRLVMKGVFQNLPNWIFHLQNLSVLCLSLTQLTEEQLILLSHLPNLVTLWLCRVYKGERLYFKQGSFNKLELLVLREFHGLFELEIDDGALPCLEELRIGSSPFLDEVPSGIQYLKNLKILINYDMPKEFVVRMQPNGGSDYWKVKHIPSVFLLFRVQGREYKLFELGDSELVNHFEGLAKNVYRITEPQDEHEFTFCKSGNNDNEAVGSSSFYRAKPTFLQTSTQELSFSSSFYSDDIEQ